ncbi:MAG: MFS transporter, partial [Myxococcota bacterium]|nr:MFS transporter [Myxococcota bacterium]
TSFVNGPMQAYLPDVFAPEQLSKVNSVFQSYRSLATVIGPAIGGVILATGDVTWAFVIDALSFVASALLLLPLPVIGPDGESEALTARSLYRDIGEGLRYIAGSGLHRFLLMFFIPAAGIYCLSGGLMMPYAEQLLAGQHGLTGATALSLLYSTMGLGGFIGSFFIPWLMGRIGALRTLLLGAAMCVVEMLIMGALPVVSLVLSVLLITASSLPLLLVPLFTLIQANTDAAFTGRAMGALDTLMLATVSVSFGLGGILADQIGLQEVFLAAGAAMLVLTLVIPQTQSYRSLRGTETDTNL